MADIQSATAEIRPGKKTKIEKTQGKYIMACPIPKDGHKNCKTFINKTVHVKTLKWQKITV